MPNPRHPSSLIATWFGSGLSPKAPGTMGTLAALPFAYLIHVYAGNMALLAAAIALFFIGWWASNKYIAQYGGEDPQAIVVDEAVGMWLVLATTNLILWEYVAAFLLFRVFDIVKPWPVSWADRKIKGGLGVMADDALAGGYAILGILFIKSLTQCWYFGIVSFGVLVQCPAMS